MLNLQLADSFSSIFCLKNFSPKKSILIPKLEIFQKNFKETWSALKKFGKFWLTEQTLRMHDMDSPCHTTSWQATLTFDFPIEIGSSAFWIKEKIQRSFIDFSSQCVKQFRFFQTFKSLEFQIIRNFCKAFLGHEFSSKNSY